MSGLERWRVLAAPAEASSSVPSTLRAAHNVCHPLLASLGTRRACSTHTGRQNSHTHKITFLFILCASMRMCVHVHAHVCVWVCVCVHRCHSIQAEVRGQLIWVDSFPPPCRSLDWSHVIRQVPLSTEPFLQPCFYFRTKSQYVVQSCLKFIIHTFQSPIQISLYLLQQEI